MRSKVIAAISATALALGLMALFKRGDTPPPVVEPSALANPSSTQRDASQRARAPGATPPAATESETKLPAATNLYARLSNGETPHVTREQLEPYLAQHHRSVGALLGALRASGDEALLREAKERFPDDPRVQFAAAFRSDSPEERQQWLEKFKQSDPNNSMSNYLLASEHFKAGHTERALQELAAAGGKAGFDNHLLDFIQNAEEAYHAAGYSEAEAKGVASSSALLPELSPLKQIGRDLAELAKRYEQAGDAASAQAVRDMGLSLGRRLDGSPQVTIIQELVGIAIERVILSSMNPDAPYGPAGQTVKSQVDAFADRRKTIRTLIGQADPILMAMSDQELAHYFDRHKMYGEIAALRWVVGQAPPK